MIIKIDDQMYSLSLTRTIEVARTLYERVSTAGVELENGKIVYFNDKSFVRTAIKGVMTPIIIPLLKKMYDERGIILDPPIKHQDLMDYTVKSLLEYMSIVEKRLEIDFTTDEASTDSCRTIKSIFASWQDATAEIASPFKDSTED